MRADTTLCSMLFQVDEKCFGFNIQMLQSGFLSLGSVIVPAQN